MNETKENLEELYREFSGNRAPWVRSGFKYYSDCAIILRVETDEPESREEAGPSAENLSQFDWGMEPGKLWNGWPQVEAFAERVRFNGMMISGDYARLIGKLPGVPMYRVWPEKDMVLFHFRHGSGAVMRIIPPEQASLEVKPGFPDLNPPDPARPRAAPDPRDRV